jgi:hypothetical protein
MEAVIKFPIEQVPQKVATAIRNLPINEAIAVASNRRATVGSAILYLRNQGDPRKFITRKKGDQLLVIRTE